MKLISKSLQDGRPIDGNYAFGVPHSTERMTFGPNRSPHIAWDELPVNTQSLVLICHDPDVPSRADEVNQEGRTVPADLPRVDFFHWVVIDIDPGLREFHEGAFSDGVTPKGKTGPDGPFGTRVGVNTYTDFLSGNPDMAGTYWGYDGPCPPWNDAIRHRYIFTLYALDVPHVAVKGEFTGADVRESIKGNVLDQVSIQGTYGLNPDVPA
jgi:Raf kinase inhibitor-like YbhB/YbcL family protein